MKWQVMDWDDDAGLSGYMNDGVVIDMVITGSPIALTIKLYYNMLLPLKTKQSFRTLNYMYLHFGFI